MKKEMTIQKKVNLMRAEPDAVIDQDLNDQSGQVRWDQFAEVVNHL